MIDRRHPELSLVRQCSWLGISRSSLYYQPVPASEEDLELMAQIDRQYLKAPFYGSRKMAAWLRNQGYQVNRKRVRRLMRAMGLEAIYRRPHTSKPAPGHQVYPYLLKGMEINRVNQVWTADITYLPMARGFLYPSATLRGGSGGHHGLAQPVCAGLAAVPYPGGGLRCGSPGWSLE
jgi:putative transposase